MNWTLLRQQMMSDTGNSKLSQLLNGGVTVKGVDAMNNIKKLKAWKELKELGYEVVTYRFCNVITGYGAFLRDKAGRMLIDITPQHREKRIRWAVWVDTYLIQNYGHFTVNIAYCPSHEILQTIADLKAGKIEVKTKDVPGKGRVPDYAGYWPPKDDCPFD